MVNPPYSIIPLIAQLQQQRQPVLGQAADQASALVQKWGAPDIGSHQGMGQFGLEQMLAQRGFDWQKQLAQMGPNIAAQSATNVANIGAESAKEVAGIHAQTAKATEHEATVAREQTAKAGQGQVAEAKREAEITHLQGLKSEALRNKESAAKWFPKIRAYWTGSNVPETYEEHIKNLDTQIEKLSSPAAFSRDEKKPTPAEDPLGIHQ